MTDERRLSQKNTEEPGGWTPAFLPQNCSLDGVLNATIEANSFAEPSRKVEIRFPPNCFIHCSALAFLCSWGLLRRSQGRQIRFRGDINVQRYLARMDLQAHLELPFDPAPRLPEAGRFIPLKLVDHFDAVHEAVNAIADLVLHQFDNAREFVPAMEWAVNEIVDNIVNHAESPVPGAVCAQYFPQQQRLDIGICDAGRGILASLRESYDLESHSKAISAALQRGVTRSRDAGLGNGMAGAVEITRANLGSLQVWTGDALYQVSESEERGFRVVPLAPGTGVQFSLDTSRPVDLTRTWIADDSEVWSYIDAEAQRVEEAGGIAVADDCESTGIRPPARRFRRKVQALLPEMETPLVLDFSGVAAASSSFLDELLGKLVEFTGVDAFDERIQTVGMNPLLLGMANVVISQRMESSPTAHPSIERPPSLDDVASHPERSQSANSLAVSDNDVVATAPGAAPVTEEPTEPSAMSDRLEALLGELEYSVVDRHVIPGRSPRFEPVPRNLHPKVRIWLADAFPDGLYRHQATAIEAGLRGENLCLATATASGKSLVFIALALHQLLSNPDSRVLALYPAKALIRDQLDKWNDASRRVGLAVGFIDGSVPRAQRMGILRSKSIVLMTPDVAHAWLASSLQEPGVRDYLEAIQLLVLDEAHVYEGVFGTNMAYFMRRLQAITRPHQVITSTATIGDTERFVQELTGKPATIYAEDSDGAGSHDKTILLVRSPHRNSFEAGTELLRHLAREHAGKFLLFADSRKAVENIVAVATREADGENEPKIDASLTEDRADILPYRAGYEEDDRVAIQHALANGTLRGVVSTSALELGLDIGDIDLVIQLDAAPTRKSFLQRLGRAGRRSPGACLVIDNGHFYRRGLRSYLEEPLEPNWVYLDNRYLQYANALCAAHENPDLDPGALDETPFSSLPKGFKQSLANELDPTEMIPPDLYPLKQRAQDGPHLEFPIRSVMEPTFRVQEKRGATATALGTLTLSQVMREAYPGAVYYYMARPYRVRQLRYRAGEIFVRKERRYFTQPISQAIIFPNFSSGILERRQSSSGFIVEADLQVSERITGFIERRGRSRIENSYGPTSPYYNKPLTRFFVSTGICWCFPEHDFARSARLAETVKAAFCIHFSIQDRDIGVGTFHANSSPLGSETVKGPCIFDATDGSLRLTHRLATGFEDVLDCASRLLEIQVDAEPDQKAILRQTAADLEQLTQLVDDLRVIEDVDEIVDFEEDEGETRIVVVRPGSPAIYQTNGEPEDVVVRKYAWTRQGLMYWLEHPELKNWRVKYESVQPIHGQSEVEYYNPDTDETRPVERADHDATRTS